MAGLADLPQKVSPTGVSGQNLNLLPLVLISTSCKPPDSNLRGNCSESIVTIVSAKWNSCVHKDHMLSVPTKIPPGFRTL